MNLRCQHCGEQIIARSFGKCPGCLKDLPEELQLSEEERARSEALRNQTNSPLDLSNPEVGFGGSVFETDFGLDL